MWWSNSPSTRGICQWSSRVLRAASSSSMVARIFGSVSMAVVLVAGLVRDNHLEAARASGGSARQPGNSGERERDQREAKGDLLGVRSRHVRIVVSEDGEVRADSQAQPPEDVKD